MDKIEIIKQTKSKLEKNKIASALRFLGENVNVFKDAQKVRDSLISLTLDFGRSSIFIEEQKIKKEIYKLINETPLDLHSILECLEFLDAENYQKAAINITKLWKNS